MEEKKDCPCPKIKCKRHGCCRECELHHAKRGRPTFCRRPEKDA
ncbi:MAG: hypothetical protein P4L75_04965 [Clostridia bacterium]|nr:hypothetical protein [Clostridia bacterium]MDR3644874.1 hypothetical protein [Clostridia bacterium]